MKKIIILLALFVLVTMPGCGQPGSTTTPNTNSVPVTPPIQTYSSPTSPTDNLPSGFFLDNPIPFGQSATNSEGFEITVLSITSGEQAWQIIENANSVNLPPAADAQYILITIRVKNVSSHGEPYAFWGTFFELYGGSGRLYQASDVNIIYPANGTYQKLEGNLNHGDELSGSIHFYIPQSETGFTLVWSDYYGYNKLFFAVR